MVLAFIGGHIEVHGYAPTVREIQVGVGLASPSTVQGHLENLERAGLITRVAGKSRTMRVAA